MPRRTTEDQAKQLDASDYDAMGDEARADAAAAGMFEDLWEQEIAAAQQEEKDALDSRLSDMDSLIGVPCILSGMKAERNRFGVQNVTCVSRTKTGETKRQKFTGQLAEQLATKYENNRVWPNRIFLPHGLVKRPFTTEDGRELHSYRVATEPVG